jgi:hypothetical protein
LIAYYDSTGKIIGGCYADSPDVLGTITKIPDGCQALYIDDKQYPNVWTDMGEYTIQNGAPVSTPIPDSVKLTNAQQAKKAELTKAFAASLLNGFTSTADGTSRTYAIDPVAMGKWTGAMSVINSGKGQANITVKDFNGNKVTLTSAQFQQMAADGFNFYSAQEQHLWDLEDQTNAATLATIGSITW